MDVQINSEISKALIKARLDLHFTQLELSQKAGISLRSVADIENCRRTSYNEDTIIRLCRALEVPYESLFGSPVPDQQALSPDKIRKHPKRLLFSGSIIIIFFMAGGLIFFWKGMGQTKRVDWILDAQLLIEPNPPRWENGGEIIVSHYNYKTPVYSGDTLNFELKWYYRCLNQSYPKYFINAYGDWAPDNEIPIWNGVLHGDSSKTVYFKVVAPRRKGIYKFRIFFAAAFAPVNSFYGHPPGSQLNWPSSAPYIQFPIEVIRK